MQSFNRAQSEALAEGFLNSIGEDKSAYSDMEIDASVRALFMIAGILLERANQNLIKGNHVGDGSLSRSLKVVNPRFEGKNITLDIEALVYYQFLNKGVKGTKSGSGMYAFKNPYPSSKMVESIRRWMKTAGISERNNKKSVFKLETKRKSIAQFDSAYAIARSIKQHGIKKTGFFDKAVQFANGVAKKELGLALKIDIINSIPTDLNGSN